MIFDFWYTIPAGGAKNALRSFDVKKYNGNGGLGLPEVSHSFFFESKKPSK